VQWCFAAVATVEPTLLCPDLLGIFDGERAAPRLHEEVPKLAHLWFEGVERRVENREWIACSDFTLQTSSLVRPGSARSGCSRSGSGQRRTDPLRRAQRH
jgi:hypothetical protein